MLGIMGIAEQWLLALRWESDHTDVLVAKAH